MQCNLYRKERDKSTQQITFLLILGSHNSNETSLSRIFVAVNQHFVEIIRKPTIEIVDPHPFYTGCGGTRKAPLSSANAPILH